MSRHEELEVTWILPDGHVGGPCGKGTFRAFGALPGDRIRPTEIKAKGRTTEVLRYETTHQGPRRDHPCAVIDSCGGCDLGRYAPDERRNQLTRMVKRALRADADPQWIASDRPVRSRIKVAIREGAVGYHAARSSELVPISDCHVAHPLIRPFIPHLLDLSGRSDLTVELRTDGHKVVACFSSKPRDIPEVFEHVAIAGKRHRGEPTLRLNVHGMELRASPKSFFQVNEDGNQKIVEWVLAAARRHAPERILDLYAGIGNLTLPLTTLDVPVAAVELEGQATKDLKVNAAQHGKSVSIHTRAVERFDTTTEPFDLVVLDPPRAGARGVMESLVKHRPKAMIYVSCHAPSLGRDLQVVRKAGYRLTDFAVVDLFGDTHHIETLACMTR